MFPWFLGTSTFHTLDRGVVGQNLEYLNRGQEAAEIYMQARDRHSMTSMYFLGTWNLDETSQLLFRGWEAGEATWKLKNHPLDEENQLLFNVMLHHIIMLHVGLVSKFVGKNGLFPLVDT